MKKYCYILRSIYILHQTGYHNTYFKGDLIQVFMKWIGKKIIEYNEYVNIYSLYLTINCIYVNGSSMITKKWLFNLTLDFSAVDSSNVFRVLGVWERNIFVTFLINSSLNMFG